MTVNGCVCECVIYAVVGWLNLMASNLLFCTILMKGKALFQLVLSVLRAKGTLKIMLQYQIQC